MRRAAHPIVPCVVVLALLPAITDYRSNRAGAEDGGTPAAHVTAAPGPAEVEAPIPLATPVSGDAAPAPDKPDVSAGSAPQESGVAGIGPDNAGAGDPGASIVYSHVVTNNADRPVVLNLAASSSLGWTVGLFESDAITLLGDHDGDGRPDTGEVAAGQSRPVAVLVMVPADGWAGDVDVTTLTVSSATEPGLEASAENRTTVNPVLGLTVESADLAFGRVAADGRVDPAVAGVVGDADETGAFYVGAGALRVTVASNAPWSGTCAGEENTGTASTVTIAGGRLEWRLAGTESWTPFAVAGALTTAAGACFPADTTGTATFVYDVRLRVERTDPPGTFSTRITFTAAP